MELQQLPQQEHKNEAIEAIEKTLGDLSSQFKNFAHIVMNHQKMAERLDTQTADTLLDLEGAQKELSETHERVSSTRGLMMKVFFVLLVFCTLYILLVL